MLKGVFASLRMTALYSEGSEAILLMYCLLGLEWWYTVVRLFLFINVVSLMTCEVGVPVSEKASSLFILQPILNLFSTISAKVT